MKTLGRILVLTALVATTLNFTACRKLFDATDDLKLVIDFNLVETTVDVVLFDAATNQQIGRSGDASVNLRITGTDRNAVMDITGMQPQSLTFQSQRGFASLALVPNAQYNPTVLNPVRFNVVAQLEGYISTSEHIVLTSTGRNVVRINMVSIDNPPSGVTINRQSGVGNLIEGAVQDEIRIGAPTDVARLSIPQGTVMRDSNGTPLSGPLDILVAHFDNTNDEAMAAFPGGLMTNVQLTDGSDADGLFYSAGLVAIEITDGSGRVASTFENFTVDLTAIVSPQTFNPETGTLVAAGDQIPVWSYDENTGQWTEESMATFVNVNGVLEVSAALSHLSYYNFDWFWGEWCYEGSSFLFQADFIICDCFSMTGAMYRQDDNAFMQYVYFWVCNNEPIQTIYAPSGVPVYIVWDNNSYSSIQVAQGYTTTYITNLCDQSQVVIPLETTTTTSIVTIEVEVYCASEPNIIIRPSFGVWYRQVGTWNWRWAEMINGDASICDVEVGQDYVVGVYYNNQWWETTITVDQESYELLDFLLDPEVCSVVFGY